MDYSKWDNLDSSPEVSEAEGEQEADAGHAGVRDAASPPGDTGSTTTSVAAAGSAMCSSDGSKSNKMRTKTKSTGSSSSVSVAESERRQEVEISVRDLKLPAERAFTAFEEEEKQKQATEEEEKRMDPNDSRLVFAKGNYTELEDVLQREIERCVARGEEEDVKSGYLHDLRESLAATRLNVCAVALKMEEWDRVKRGAKAVLEDDPDHVRALYFLAWVLHNEGKNKAALRRIGRAAEIIREQGTQERDADVLRLWDQIRTAATGGGQQQAGATPPPAPSSQPAQQAQRQQHQHPQPRQDQRHVPVPASLADAVRLHRQAVTLYAQKALPQAQATFEQALANLASIATAATQEEQKGEDTTPSASSGTADDDAVYELDAEGNMVLASEMRLQGDENASKFTAEERAQAQRLLQIVRIGLGITRTNMKRHDEAVDMLRAGIEGLRADTGGHLTAAEQSHMLRALEALSDCYAVQKNWQAGLDAGREALTIARRQNMTRREAQMHVSVGHMLQGLERPLAETIAEWTRATTLLDQLACKPAAAVFAAEAESTGRASKTTAEDLNSVHNRLLRAQTHTQLAELMSHVAGVVQFNLDAVKDGAMAEDASGHFATAAEIYCELRSEIAAQSSTDPTVARHASSYLMAEEDALCNAAECSRNDEEALHMLERCMVLDEQLQSVVLGGAGPNQAQRMHAWQVRKADAVFHWALRAKRTGRADEAVQGFRDACAAYEEANERTRQKEALKRLGAALRAQADFEGAIDAFRRARGCIVGPVEDSEREGRAIDSIVERLQQEKVQHEHADANGGAPSDAGTDSTSGASSRQGGGAGGNKQKRS